ncbi:hypothetical protein OMD46_16655 [Pseudomonas sp. MDMC_285]|nr:hypothetical protein [Pseudomonas sp. MDMC_285]
MTAALDLLQWRHDMAEPECDTKFIDTAEGSNWLAGAVDDLIEDTLYVAGKRVNEQVSQLEDALAEHVAAKYNAGHDYDGALGQVLRNVLAGDIDKASGALRLLITKEDVRAMAEELVRPLAQVYADSLEDDHD